MAPKSRKLKDSEQRHATLTAAVAALTPEERDSALALAWSSLARVREMLEAFYKVTEKIGVFASDVNVLEVMLRPYLTAGISTDVYNALGVADEG